MTPVSTTYSQAQRRGYSSAPGRNRGQLYSRTRTVGDEDMFAKNHDSTRRTTRSRLGIGSDEPAGRLPDDLQDRRVMLGERVDECRVRCSGPIRLQSVERLVPCTVATFGSDPIPKRASKNARFPAAARHHRPRAAASRLSATAGNAQVSLSWSYSGVTAATQEVYRDTDSNPSGRVRIASVSSSTRSYTSTGLSNGTTYWFWIKNTNAGVATDSNAASATPSGGSTQPPPTGDFRLVVLDQRHAGHRERNDPRDERHLRRRLPADSMRARRWATAARPKASSRSSEWRTARRCVMS